MSVHNVTMSSFYDRSLLGGPQLLSDASGVFFSQYLSPLVPFFERFKLDFSIIIPLCLYALGLWTWLSVIWTHAYDQISMWFTSSISISSDDDVFECILGWLAAENILRNPRCLVAKSKNGNAFDEQGQTFRGTHTGVLETHDSNPVMSRLPLRYEPFSGQHFFMRKQRLFYFQRHPKHGVQNGYSPNPYGQGEMIKVTCIGRSTQPIKNLITEARVWSMDQEKSLTAIRRPAPRNLRCIGRLWSPSTTRLSRPMDTVVLDPRQKAAVISDMTEYLHPTTAKWYADRGIPYRRGYLFHGPSGTGKTSFATALAGFFGLDIYVISLLEPTLTEDELLPLFSDLPKRCIVLLEDIDSAGISRSNSLESKANLAAFRDFEHDGMKNGGISLSGLLNAIDGVASHEGRMLILTTNYPGRLDEALLRPGRVDMQVKFSLAGRPQIRELFLRMYDPKDFQIDRNIHGKTVDGDTRQEFIEPSAVCKIADTFAESIPEQVFTPAEIQGFLLNKKKEPEQALAEVEKWIERQIEAKGRDTPLVKKATESVPVSS